MTYETEPTAQRLHAFLTRWLQEHPGWACQGPLWARQLRPASEVAADLLQDAEFREVRLAGWLQSPDGALVEMVVGSVLPWPQGLEFKLLTDAVLLAAQAKRESDWRTAAVFTVVALPLVALVLQGIWHEGGRP